MRKRIGPLDCLVREGEAEREVVVLLHGFGASASDLAPLADLIDPEGHWTMVFPNAPLEVAIGGGFSGRGWFPISVRELETGVDFQNARPPRLAESASAVGEAIFELDAKKLVLGGFSQGAMVSTEYGLNSPGEIEGLMLLSGTLIDRARWLKLAPNLKDKAIFQCHGSMDQVLPFGLADNLAGMLRSAGANVDFLRFAGGHDIPPVALGAMTKFLRGIRTRSR